MLARISPNVASGNSWFVFPGPLALFLLTCRSFSPLRGSVCVVLFLLFKVPEDITMGAFSFEIRKHMPELDSTKAIYLFINNTLPSQSMFTTTAICYYWEISLLFLGTLMSDIYSRYKEEDGFVYVTFSGENAFGSSS